jgi:P-type Ca2+ transporter type 2C
MVGEIAFIKGAPREVLELCDQAVMGDGICPLDDELRTQILAQIDAYAQRGLRVLGLAFRRLPSRSGSYISAKVERELIFLGLMAMLDPVRRKSLRQYGFAGKLASAW